MSSVAPTNGTEQYRLADGRWRIVRKAFFDGKPYEFSIECINPAFGYRRADAWQTQMLEDRRPPAQTSEAA
jgi:hypothetical protein